MESKHEHEVPPRLLPARPAGVRLFARVQITFAAILFLLMIFRTAFGMLDTSTSMHIVTLWWDLPSIMAWGAALAYMAAFLGYYVFNGSRGARHAVLILSAANVLSLLTWYALWLAGTIPVPYYTHPFDRPFFPKVTWLGYGWGLVNIWYFGFSGARRFYTDPA